MDTGETPGCSGIVCIDLLAGHWRPELAPTAIIIHDIDQPVSSSYCCHAVSFIAFFFKGADPAENDLAGIENGGLIRVSQSACQYSTCGVLDFNFPVGHAARSGTSVGIAGEGCVAVEGGDDVAGRFRVGGSPALMADEVGLGDAAIAGDILSMLEPGNGGLKVFLITSRDALCDFFFIAECFYFKMDFVL